MFCRAKQTTTEIIRITVALQAERCGLSRMYERSSSMAAMLVEGAPFFNAVFGPRRKILEPANDFPGWAQLQLGSGVWPTNNYIQHHEKRHHRGHPRHS